MNNFYQVCYGKPDQTNWSTFNISDNATTSIISFFEKEAVKNTPGYVSENFIVNNSSFFELSSENGTVEMSKTSYDFTDVFGRTASFTHGFVFDDRDEILEKPEELLAVSSDNFKFSVEETKTVPNELKMNPVFTVKRAMEFANIGKEMLDGIMAAVNVFMYDSTKCMCLVYNGNEEQRKALMYLILHFLPYRLRYDLSFSTASASVSNDRKFIIITDKADSPRHYLNLVNSETDFDIDGNELKNIVRDYPFYYEYLKRFDDFDDFCSEFKIFQTKMGFDRLCSYDDLKIIYSFYSYSNNGESFDRIASDDKQFGSFAFTMLNKAPLGNSIIDNFIALILEEYIKRDLNVNEILVNNVSSRAEKTATGALRKANERLYVKYLLSLGEEKVVESLNEQYKSDFELFKKSVSLIKEFKGSDIVDKLYATLADECGDYESLETLFAEYRQLSNNGSGNEFFKKRLFEIASKEMKKDFDSPNYLNDVLDLCSKTYDEMFNDNKSSNFLNELVDAFWSDYDIESFEFDDDYIENIKTVKGSENEPELVNILCKTNDLIEALGESVNRKKLVDKFEFFNLDEYKISQNLKDKMCAAVLESYGSKKNKNLKFWYKVALFDSENDPSNAVKNLIEWEIGAFLDDDAFDSFFDDADGKTIRFAKVLLDAIDGDNGYFNEVARKSDDYYLLKSRISTLTKAIKHYDKNNKSDNDNFKGKLKNLFSRG